MFSNSQCRVISIARISGGLLALYKTLKISCSSRQQVWQKSWTGSFQAKSVLGTPKCHQSATKALRCPRALLLIPSPAWSRFPCAWECEGFGEHLGVYRYFWGGAAALRSWGSFNQKWSEAPSWLRWRTVKFGICFWGISFRTHHPVPLWTEPKIRD